MPSQRRRKRTSWNPDSGMPSFSRPVDRPSVQSCSEGRFVFPDIAALTIGSMVRVNTLRDGVSTHPDFSLRFARSIRHAQFPQMGSGPHSLRPVI